LAEILGAFVILNFKAKLKIVRTVFAFMMRKKKIWFW